MSATLAEHVRHALIAYQLSHHLPDPPGRVIDLGSGHGEQGIRLARRGFSVTLLDTSETMVAAARERLVREEASTVQRTEVVLGRAEDAADLVTDGPFDVVLCHALLPYFEDPSAILGLVAELARPGGTVSVVFKNGDALAMLAGLDGRYADAVALLEGAHERDDAGRPLHGHGLREVSAAAGRAGVAVEGWYGVQTFTAHRHEPAEEPVVTEAFELEEAVGRRDPYRQVARQLHLIGHRAD